MARPAPNRFAPSWFGPRLRFGLGFAAMVVLAFLPTRWLGVSAWIASPVQRVIAPAQHGLNSAASWVRGRGRTAGVGATPETAELERQRDQYRFSLLQAHDQIRELRRQISELSRSVEASPGDAIRVVTAPVIGAAADLTSTLLTVRAGKAQGVEPGAVAVVRGVHLVGKVVRSDERSCTVVPITDRSQPTFRAVIMLDPDRPGPLCQLQPDGKGRLVGPVWEEEAAGQSGAVSQAAIEPEMLVRLSDDSERWPRSARMLIVGRVVSVKPRPTQPLRQDVIVEPLYPLDRVSEVTIRSLVVEGATPASAPVEGAGTGGAP